MALRPGSRVEISSHFMPLPRSSIMSASSSGDHLLCFFAGRMELPGDMFSTAAGIWLCCTGGATCDDVVACLLWYVSATVCSGTEAGRVCVDEGNDDSSEPRSFRIYEISTVKECPAVLSVLGEVCDRKVPVRRSVWLVLAEMGRDSACG